MKLLLSILGLLVWAEIASADIGPNKLVRKSDGAVLGVGYSNFEGTANLDKYDVLPVTQDEIPAIREEIRVRVAQERQDNQPVDVPIEAFGAGAAGALAAFGGRGLVLRLKKKREPA